MLDKFKEMPVVSVAQSKSESLNNLIKSMASMTSSLGAMIILASILSIAVIYNITTINIFDRQRELATLKVLGFKNNEIRSLIFNENYLITAFGICAGLPLGKWLGDYLMAMVQTDTYSFKFVAGTQTYLLAAALTVGFTLLANLTLMRKISRINMVEVLKSNE